MSVIRSTVDGGNIFNGTTGYVTSSLDPLPDDIRHAMIAMGVIGLFSSVSTFTLFSFLTYRMVAWRKYYEHPIGSNQIFVLIYNLLLADFQQALSFCFSFHWLIQNKLVGPNAPCFAQGWLIQIGDVSSGFWVLSIGAHTFINLVLQKPIPMKYFIAWVISLWTFCFILTAVGPLTHKGPFFVPAGNWCWINSDYEHARLYLHYAWIFLAEIGSVIIYTTVFFALRGQLAEVSFVTSQTSAGLSSLHSNGNDFCHRGGGQTTTTVVATSPEDLFANSRQRIARAARYMVVYPFAYVALTLPLAAGRVAAMMGKNVPLVYLAVSGGLIASCGFVDTILYLSTRRALVKSSVGMKSKHEVVNSRVAKNSSETRESLDEIRMIGFRSSEEDAISLPPLQSGQIVVSHSIVRSEDSPRTAGEATSAVPRTESLGSLVNKEERGESWPA